MQMVDSKNRPTNKHTEKKQKKTHRKNKQTHRKNKQTNAHSNLVLQAGLQSAFLLIAIYVQQEL